MRSGAQYDHDFESHKLDAWFSKRKKGQKISDLENSTTYLSNLLRQKNEEIHALRDSNNTLLQKKNKEIHALRDSNNNFQNANTELMQANADLQRKFETEEREKKEFYDLLQKSEQNYNHAESQRIALLQQKHSNHLRKELAKALDLLEEPQLLHFVDVYKNMTGYSIY